MRAIAQRGWVVVLVGALFAVGCSGATEPPPAPSQMQTAPNAVPTEAAPTPNRPASQEGDPQAGQAAFQRAGCVTCHGEAAQGGVFPGALKLAGTALTFEEFQAQVRSPRDPSKGMPPFAPAQVSDQDLQNIYAWLKTLP